MTKSIKILTRVVDEATKRFEGKWVLDEKNYDILKSYCEAIDIFARLVDAECDCEVFVNEKAMEVSVRLEHMSLEVETNKHIFYVLSKRANRVTFSRKPNTVDIMYTEFAFPSVWYPSKEGVNE